MRSCGPNTACAFNQIHLNRPPFSAYGLGSSMVTCDPGARHRSTKPITAGALHAASIETVVHWSQDLSSRRHEDRKTTARDAVGHHSTRVVFCLEIDATFIRSRNQRSGPRLVRSGDFISDQRQLLYRKYSVDTIPTTASKSTFSSTEVFVMSHSFVLTC